MITSIDKGGPRKGFDLPLVKAITSSVSVPVIASGGYGETHHLAEVVSQGADAVAFADALHYDRTTIPQLREAARAQGLKVRQA